MRGLRRDVGLVHRLVRQHRLPDDVADRIDMRHVGALLLVHVDEAAVGHGHAGLSAPMRLPFGLRPTATSTMS